MSWSTAALRFSVPASARSLGVRSGSMLSPASTRASMELPASRRSCTRQDSMRLEKLSMTACTYALVPSSNRITVASMCQSSLGLVARMPTLGPAGWMRCAAVATRVRAPVDTTSMQRRIHCRVAGPGRPDGQWERGGRWGRSPCRQWPRSPRRSGAGGTRSDTTNDHRVRSRARRGTMMPAARARGRWRAARGAIRTHHAPGPARAAGGACRSHSARAGASGRAGRSEGVQLPLRA